MPMHLPRCQKIHQSYLQISKSAIYSVKWNISYILSNNMGSQPMFLYNYVGPALMSILLNPKVMKRGFHFVFLNVKIPNHFCKMKKWTHFTCKNTLRKITWKFFFFEIWMSIPKTYIVTWFTVYPEFLFCVCCKFY